MTGSARVGAPRIARDAGHPRPARRLDLPLFTYGLLKPDQPAYGGVVAPLVTAAAVARLPRAGSATATACPCSIPRGRRALRGGAALHPARSGRLRRGLRVRTPPPLSVAHHRRPLTAPPGRHQRRRVNVLQGRHPERGIADEWFTSWSADADPLLRYGLHAVRRAASTTPGRLSVPAGRQPRCLGAFYGLQSAYLLLWSAVERYAAVACAPSDDALARFYRLGDDQAFRESVVAARVSPRAKAADARDPARSRRIREDGSGAMYAWESVRSTLGHPGRTASADGTLLRRSLVELHDTLRLLLLTRLPGVADTWRELDPDGSPTSGCSARWCPRTA